MLIKLSLIFKVLATFVAAVILVCSVSYAHVNLNPCELLSFEAAQTTREIFVLEMFLHVSG